MFFIVALLLLAVGRACNAFKADWYSPKPPSTRSSQAQVWYEREIQELIWQADVTDYGIYLTQGTPTKSLKNWVCIYRQYHGARSPLQELRLIILPSGKGINNTDKSRMLWAVQSFTFDLSLTNSFFLQINDGNHSFSASSSFVIKTAAQNSTNTCSQSNTTTTLRENNPSLSDHKTQMVGLAVGVGLGIPLLLTLASLVFLLTSSRRVERDVIPDIKLGVENTMEDPRKDAYYHHETSGQNEIFEISNSDVVHEAPDGNAVLDR